jgi:hypothetical protein
MFTRKRLASRFGRATALATVAALALTAAAPSMAFAAPRGKDGSAVAHGITDISARQRVAVRRGHYYRGGGAGGAAAAAAFAGIVGTGLAIAASQNRRDYYDGYYGGPAYGGPAYYGGGYAAPYGYGGW